MGNESDVRRQPRQPAWFRARELSGGADVERSDGAHIDRFDEILIASTKSRWRPEKALDAPGDPR
jgi:hypothetical protein